MTLTQKEILSYAGHLALFANCEDQIAVEKFGAKNEGFFPPRFLEDNRPPRGSLKRGQAQEVEWMPTWWGFQAGLLQAWKERFPADWAVTLIALTHPKTRFEAWPYQRALMFMAVEPWRARFCAICGGRFVAEKPATRFCSAKCAGGARKNSRDAWWCRHGERWRRKRRKRRTPPRGTR
jgi:hypothetical protein